MEHIRVKILVRGIVQGVGFRPFVYSLANSLDLKGFVMNSSEGVIIEIEGDNNSTFIERLTKEAPPLAQIMEVDITPMPYYGYQDFQIIKSEDAGRFTHISPDVSICDDCLRELLDKDNRRYLYPFINCTNCGPRYTITRSIPYDRPNTTMSVFKMCAECEDEYHSPVNRRFHAQPNACSICGPQVELIIKTESNPPSPPFSKGGMGGFSSKKLEIDKKGNPIKEAIRLLKQGAIVAIKGLGGFHIACDATNEEAVNRLRLRKRKSNKPFALMAPDIEIIKKFCEVSKEEERLLISHKRPIVLLKKREDLVLPDAIAPNNPCLGFMLPYTPLHYLLFHYPNPPSPPFNSPLSKGGYRGVHGGLGGIIANFDALIMTSGNLAEEPIVIDNDEAISRLSEIVDAFLLHNRDIFMRVDDSVMRHKLFIRRSRGYVPNPIPLHEDGPEVLGCGADIKNTFTLTKGSFAIPSQHIGDMENYETLMFFEESLENLKSVYRVNPVAIGYDLHPNYLSTQWALSQKTKSQISNLKSQILLYGIQHHYAHIASVMAEKDIKRKVIGIAFDGTGYGTDENLWGGEFLIADIKGFKRAGHFKYIPLPGGEMAIKEPWRIAVAYVKDIAGSDTMDYLKSIGFIERYGNERLNNILKICDKRPFSPLSSGAGRLFDAVSAILGICDKNTFEGEAAMALESITRPDVVDDYPADIKLREPIEIDFSQTILRIINDLVNGVDKSIIASNFHNAVATVILRVVQKLSSIHMIEEVVLSGGVFQNIYLLERTIARLRSIGMEVYINEKVPCNDAGISLGQAYILRERIKSEKHS
jgi:hydrogenase maturation protein HypF